MYISINIVRHLLRKVEIAGHGALLQSAPGYSQVQAMPEGEMLEADVFLPIIDHLNQHYPPAQLAYEVEYKFFHSGQLNMLGALGQLFQVASNMQEVTEAFYRYYSQFNKMFALAVEERGEYVASKIINEHAQLWSRRAYQLTVEMFVYGTIRMCREIFSDESLSPHAITFPYRLPEAERLLMEQVAGTKISVGEELVVVWPGELFVRPLPFANPALGEYLKAYLDKQQASAEKPDVVAEIRQLIAGTLPQLLSLDEAAAAVFLSPRSLQRRLKERGYHFQRLLEETRAGVAQGALKEGRLQVKEIAGLCGFKDVNSFFRAFKKWTGKTPGLLKQTGMDSSPLKQTGMDSSPLKQTGMDSG